MIVRGGVERRLTESVDVALNLADDIVVINTFEGVRRFTPTSATPFSRNVVAENPASFANMRSTDLVTNFSRSPCPWR